MATPHKVIVDTDPGVDDVLALLLLLASPEIQIELISVTFGNTIQEAAYANIFKLYGVARKHLQECDSNGSEDVFRNMTRDRPTLLAKGASGPLEGSLDLAEYFHGPDGLSDISTTHPEYLASLSTPDPALSITSTPGHGAILEILEREPENSVTLLSLGPLTTVAMAYQKNPAVFRRVKEVVTMGGAFDVAGNTSATAEFNIFADPFAAEVIFRGATENKFKMALLPLDITSQHTIHFDKLIRSASPSFPSSTLQSFLTAILSRPRIVLRAFGYTTDEFEMHDPLAAYYVIDNASSSSPTQAEKPNGANPRWLTTRRQFLIERFGEWTKGMCIVDRRGTNEVVGAVRAHDGVLPEDKEFDHAETQYDEKVKAEYRGLNVHVVVKTPGPRVFEDFFLDRVGRSGGI